MSSTHVANPDLSEGNVRLGTAGLGVQQGAGLVGIIGLVASAVIGFGGMFGTTPTFLMKSWTQNYMFVLAISLGALFFVFIQHLTRAGWSTTIRRPAELIAANLKWSWVGLIPFAALWLSGGGHVEGSDAAHSNWGPGVLFPWADLEALKAHHPAEYDIVAAKSAYLNSTFFWIRAIIYVTFWGVVSTWFLRTSIAQDATGDIRLTEKMQKWSGPIAIGFGLTITFAAFDWIMSLSPAWFSTMFGVYFFCGCCTCGFSVLIIAVLRLQSLGRLKQGVNREHYQDMGKLLFAFGMIFWAYIGFSQYMLIWYANIPEETGWFLGRQIGGWGTLSFVLLFGHFVVPFVLLISKWTKRLSWYLLAAAIWMLFFGWFDLYWLIMPVVPADAMTAKTYMEVVEAHADASTHIFNPLNFTMLAGVGGIYLWMTIRRMRGSTLLAIRDPRLHEGLSFENQ